MGMNSGIQDVHNLAWKLAFVLTGRAGPELLETYEMERRPVAEANLVWSLENGKRFPAIRKALAAGDAARSRELLDAQGGHVSALGQDLGFAYRYGAVLPDGTGQPEHRPDRYVPTARPGHRAPAVALPGGRSTLDLYDLGFTLLTGSADPGWTGAGAGAGADAGVGSGVALPEWLRTVRIGAGPLRGVDVDLLHHVHGIDPTGAVLVRPDGHVAWRAATAPADPAHALLEALRLLHLRVGGSAGQAAEDRR
jgi:hypothetical protein